jgi:hypothetical protein
MSLIITSIKDDRYLKGVFKMKTEYLVTLLGVLIAVLLTVLVTSSREKNKKIIFQNKFNPIVLDDNGKKRFFSWHSRDPVDLIEIEGQGQQIFDILVPLSKVIQENANLKLQFSFPDKLQGEIVYEISSDFQSKWRLLGGKGKAEGDQVLVILKF